MSTAKSTKSPFWAVCFLVSAASACSSAAGEPPATPAPADDTANDFEALYRARADSTALRFTEADVRFVTDMIGHHAQALEMATLVPDRSENATIGVLAARIVNAQEDEIELMRRWLSDRGQPVPDPGVPAEHAHLPGMVTPEQLTALAAARGQEFDRLFLTYMIQHHQGAVDMVHGLFGTDGAAQGESTFRLASDIQVDQITEISRMEQMLATLSAPTGR
jgi:uncharacterized protein (DUF305 family)